MSKEEWTSVSSKSRTSVFFLNGPPFWHGRKGTETGKEGKREVTLALATHLSALKGTKGVPETTALLSFETVQ